MEIQDEFQARWKFMRNFKNDGNNAGGFTNDFNDGNNADSSTKRFKRRLVQTTFSWYTKILADGRITQGRKKNEGANDDDQVNMQ